MTEWIAVREIEPSHGLVDDGETGAPLVFRLVPNAAASERDAQDWKVSGAYEVDANL